MAKAYGEYLSLRDLRRLGARADVSVKWSVSCEPPPQCQLPSKPDSVPILQCASTYDKQLHFLGACSSEISEVRFPSLRGRRSEDKLQTGEITTKVPARLKQLKEGQASPDDPVLVHHEKLQQRKDQSGPDNIRTESPGSVHHEELKQRKDHSSPDNCRPDSLASIHHEALQQRKDKSGPVNCRPEIPNPVYHEVLKDQSSPDKFRFECPPPSITRSCIRGKTSPVQTICRSENPSPIHHEVLQHWKDQSSPDNCHPESPAAIHHE
ncbi:hypothetical protein TNCV_2442031 [Trichonephila clavipes]|nr:hypothetical protein TNCV_2442031 [Trichonephila clavipes]